MVRHPRRPFSFFPLLFHPSSPPSRPPSIRWRSCRFALMRSEELPVYFCLCPSFSLVLYFSPLLRLFGPRSNLADSWIDKRSEGPCDDLDRGHNLEFLMSSFKSNLLFPFPPLTTAPIETHFPCRFQQDFPRKFHPDVEYDRAPRGDLPSVPFSSSTPSPSKFAFSTEKNTFPQSPCVAAAISDFPNLLLP